MHCGQARRGEGRQGGKERGRDFAGPMSNCISSSSGVWGGAPSGIEFSAVQL